MAGVTLRRIADPAVLAPAWRDLEQRASGSFFQSWTWTGCLLNERFDRPMLLRADQHGAVAALALCNRRPTGWTPDTVWVGESGRAAIDSVFVEHNGPLVADGSGLLDPCVAALKGGIFRRVILSGVDPAMLASAQRLGRACHLRQTRLAPFLDLSGFTGPDDHLAGMGASTRQQLRRSRRLYQADGPLQVIRARTVAEADLFLERLVALHTAGWRQRGKPGAFAEPAVMRFHRALIGTGVPRGEVDLLSVQAGERQVGLLYNFRWRDGVCAYQSGFTPPATPQFKPGLVCHAAAIEYYRTAGIRRYDFLAGDDRYKTSLGNGSTPMHWLELAHPASPRGLALRFAGRQTRLRNVVRAFRSAPASIDSRSSSAPAGRPASSQVPPSTPT